MNYFFFSKINEHFFHHRTRFKFQSNDYILHKTFETVLLTLKAFFLESKYVVVKPILSQLRIQTEHYTMFVKIYNKLKKFCLICYSKIT